jgi:hypothetical protein
MNAFDSLEAWNRCKTISFCEDFNLICLNNVAALYGIHVPYKDSRIRVHLD